MVAGFWKGGTNMTGARILCFLLLIALAATAVVQRRTIATMRSDNATLQQQNEQARQLARENADIANLRVQNQEAAGLMQANKDLPKLRNEIRQLRQQKPETHRLRAENARLLATIKSSTNAGRPRFADMEGYVAKEAWTQAGFATAEAALQTFFWAIQQRDFVQVSECLSPDNRQGFAKEFEGKTEEERSKIFDQGIGQLGGMTGYRISEKEQVADDTVNLGIQAAAGGHVLRLQLRRFGNEWKIGGEPPKVNRR
jgi:TolA-binding protein